MGDYAMTDYAYKGDGLPGVNDELLIWGCWFFLVLIAQTLSLNLIIGKMAVVYDTVLSMGHMEMVEKVDYLADVGASMPFIYALQKLRISSPVQ